MTTLDTIGVKPRVLEILGGNPALPYSTIADKVGVTREWVRQIALKNGYPLRHGVLKPKICPICGETFYKRKNIHCSRTCRFKAEQKTIVLNCHQCGKPIERKPSTMRNKSGKYYCSRVCYYEGRWRKNHSLKET